MGAGVGDDVGASIPIGQDMVARTRESSIAPDPSGGRVVVEVKSRMVSFRRVRAMLRKIP